MKLHTVNTGYSKLDGGAMFGVVPRYIWKDLNPPDDNNMCNWAMRCMLIEDGDRLILIDNGIGDKQSEKFFSYYYLSGDTSLEGSLKELGFTRNDITDVVLTHLHFDHCGGSIEWNEGRDGYRPAFNNARYWSNEQHWDWAVNPNQREKASFLKENILPIQESGQLHFINKGESPFNDVDFRFVSGHTESMMIPVISYKGKKVVFMADLLPSAAHIPIPYVMAYDTRPLLTLSEKSDFLNEAVENDYILFFEHDPVNECCNLRETDRGVRPSDLFSLSEL